MIPSLTDDTGPRPGDDTEPDEPCNAPTTELAERKLAELSRLCAVMGFIPANEATPRVIDDRYEIQRPLGSGGMGVVFLAHDRLLENSRVALKIVRESYLREVPDAPAKLRREAQQMARLRGHPNVVNILDVGGDADSAYLTMEYIDGRDLRCWAWAESRNQDEILAAYLGAATGLHAGHQRGIVHRDFKPENVLIDSSGAAKVVDFGISILGAEPLDRNTNDHGGDAKRTAIRGTLAYMAPEQIAGEWPDARSDQFSFCVALWEALTGELPYKWLGAQSQLAALERGPRQAAELPWWLRRALLGGMSQRPGDRFQSMGELIEIIHRGRARPRKLARLGLGVAAAVSTGVLGVVLSSDGDRGPAVTPTCEPFIASIDAHWGPTQHEALAARSELLGQDVAWALDQLDALAHDWTQAARATCVVDQAPAIDNPVRRCLDAWLSSLDQVDELLAKRGDAHTLAQAPDLLATLAPPNGDFCALRGRPEDTELAALVERARGAAVLGDRKVAATLSDAALERARSLAGERRYTTELAHAHAARAEVHMFAQAFEDAEVEFRAAEAQAIGVNDLETLLRVRVLWARTVAVLLDDVRMPIGDAQLERALPLLTAAELPANALIHGEYAETRALVDEGLGRYDAALDGYDTAVAFFERVDNPILTARALQDRGTFHHGQNRYDAAEADLREAIARLEAAGVSLGYPRLVNAQFNLGVILFERVFTAEDEDQATRYGVESLRLLEQVIEHATGELRSSALGIGCQVATDTGQDERLRALAPRALAALDTDPSLGPEQRDELEARVYLALMIRFADTDAEAHVRELLEREALSVDLRWALAYGLVEHLDRTDRCAEAQRTLADLPHVEQLRELEDFRLWTDERKDSTCE